MKLWHGGFGVNAVGIPNLEGSDFQSRDGQIERTALGCGTERDDDLLDLSQSGRRRQGHLHFLFLATRVGEVSERSR